MAAAAVAVILIGALRVPFTTTDSAWFAALELRAFSPPGWAFGVVWPILYALLRTAGALVSSPAWVCFATARNYAIWALN